MTLLEQLQAHKGGLIQLKTQLYRYDDRGHDGDAMTEEQVESGEPRREGAE